MTGGRRRISADGVSVGVGVGETITGGVRRGRTGPVGGGVTTDGTRRIWPLSGMATGVGAGVVRTGRRRCGAAVAGGAVSSGGGTVVSTRRKGAVAGAVVGADVATGGRRTGRGFGAGVGVAVSTATGSASSVGGGAGATIRGGMRRGGDCASAPGMQKSANTLISAMPELERSQIRSFILFLPALETQTLRH